MGKMDLYTVKVTAKKLNRRKMMFKIASVITTVSISVLLLFYGFVNFADNIGNFTVNIAKSNANQQIALSNDASFSETTTVLQAPPLQEMTNITESWLPDDINNIDGPHNGDGPKTYIAYTFYLKNFGNVPIDYQATISLMGVTKNADQALRVKVYYNDNATTYAQLSKDGTPEPNTTPFFSTTEVLNPNQPREHLLAGEYDKYTIVVWLEGNDPECIDNIKGGKIRMVMNFNVIPPNNN